MSGAMTAEITDRDSLLAAIAGYLNRDDLTDAIPTFVQLFEAKMRKDRRARKFQNAGSVTITGDDMSMPSDFQSPHSWYHDGSTFFGRITSVTLYELPEIKRRMGPTGVPMFAAILPDLTVRFAPSPDANYTTKLAYWRTLEALTASNPTNWMLVDHPEIYLYGALVEAALYLKDDAADQRWSMLLEKGLTLLDQATTNIEWGGPMEVPFEPIG